jgi:hypothetical protein
MSVRIAIASGNGAVFRPRRFICVDVSGVHIPTVLQSESGYTVDDFRIGRQMREGRTDILRIEIREEAERVRMITSLRPRPVAAQAYTVADGHIVERGQVKPSATAIG